MNEQTDVKLQTAIEAKLVEIVEQAFTNKFDN
jgi:hypothetical protein